MSKRINTILILAAAGDIDEATARRFHSLGQKKSLFWLTSLDVKLAN